MNGNIKSWILTMSLLCTCFSMGFAGSLTAHSDKNPERYENELKALNEFLEYFDDGSYGYMEVVDGFIVIRFKEGKYSKFRMEDMQEPVLYERWSQINWDCKNESDCVETDWNDSGKESGVLFSEFGSTEMGSLLELLNNFIKAFNKKDRWSGVNY